MKKLSLGIVLGVAAIFVVLFAYKAVSISDRPEWSDYFGTPEYTKVDTKKPLEEQTRRLQMAGRMFEIPLVYIASQLDEGLVQNEGLILEYVLPEFKSKLDFVNRDAYKRAFNAGRFGRILIEPAAPRPSFDIVIENRRRRLTKEEYVGTRHGLEYYKWYYGMPDAPKYWSDTYIEETTDGKIVSFIECSTMSRGSHMKRPGCTHKFFHKSLRYYVSYNRDNYLATWAEQRRKATEFVDSYEIPQPTIKEDQ